MSSWEFDSVETEKADAIRRFNRNRNFIFCFHRLITALALLCSFPYFPLLKEISSSYLSLFNRQLYVFCLINAMIFVIYRFSTIAARVSNDGAAADVSQPDLYDQYVSLSSTSGLREKLADEDRKSAVSPAMEIQLSEEFKFCDKQIIICENAELASEEKHPIGDLTETKEILRLRRTRSDKYTTVKKKKITHLRELRRSETENGRGPVVVAGGERKSMEDMNSEEFRKSMEDMNSEEFRFTIERFIASKKKGLRDENFAAVMEERENKPCFTVIIT